MVLSLLRFMNEEDLVSTVCKKMILLLVVSSASDLISCTYLNKQRSHSHLALIITETVSVVYSKTVSDFVDTKHDVICKIEYQ